MKRGPYKLKDRSVYEKALALRREGFGYRYISREVGISHDTIKHWVSDIKVDPQEAHRKFTLRVTATETDNLTSRVAVRSCLLRQRGRRCQSCGLTEWLSKPITLEVNHKDGDTKNNADNNLELLCPNCHSYTPTWRRGKASLLKKQAAPW